MATVIPADFGTRPPILKAARRPADGREVTTATLEPPVTGTGESGTGGRVRFVAAVYLLSRLVALLNRQRT